MSSQLQHQANDEEYLRRLGIFTLDPEMYSNVINNLRLQIQIPSRPESELRPEYRQEPIFQDEYYMSDDEWDDLLYGNAERPRAQWAPVYDLLNNDNINPKVGDIVTFSICSTPETESKMKNEELECPICYTSVCKWDAIHLPCSHVFCESCITSHLDTLHQNHNLLPSCALCRSEYTVFEIPNPEMSQKIEIMLRK